jgi:hypothetical protein
MFQFQIVYLLYEVVSEQIYLTFFISKIELAVYLNGIVICVLLTYEERRLLGYHDMWLL